MTHREEVTDLDRLIGHLDRMLSEFLVLCKRVDLDEADVQTLKHHAEDLVGVGNRGLELLKSLRDGIKRKPTPLAAVQTTTQVVDPLEALEGTGYSGAEGQRQDPLSSGPGEADEWRGWCSKVHLAIGGSGFGAPEFVLEEVGRIAELQRSGSLALARLYQENQHLRQLRDRNPIRRKPSRKPIRRAKAK